MKNRIITIAMALVALFGVSLTLTAAQSRVVNLAGNEVAEINCDGSRLILERTSKTEVTATCRANNNAPPPEPTPDTSADLAVVDLILINADTDQDIGPLTDGATINFNDLGTQNLSVRAETQPSTVGSVIFGLDGNTSFPTENIAPYAIAGDNNGDYNSWTPGVGQHTLTVTPYTKTNGGGTAGTALTVTFSVIDDDSDPPSDDPPSDDPPSDDPPSDDPPSSSVPLCEDHDPNSWHPLYDAEKNCHYDHEHKHDPNEVNDIFGPPGAWFGGGEISYPWQTFAGANGNYPAWDGNPDNLENVAKHRVYGWITRRDIPSNGRDVWIKGFRVQYHAMSGPPGTLTRHHSFSLEAQVCNSSDECGIVRTGGWLDFGNLEVSGHGAVPLAGQEDAIQDTGRRRIHYFHADAETRSDPRFKAEFFWYGRNAPPAPPYGELHPLSIAIATADVFSNVDPNNPEAPNFFCPDFQCNKNGSTIQAHVVQLEVKSNFDSDGDGLADFVGYTDRYGLLNENCNEIGLDCIPLIIENAPVGRPQHRDDTHLGLTTAGAQDFDTSPPGEWWITFPN